MNDELISRQQIERDYHNSRNTMDDSGTVISSEGAAYSLFQRTVAQLGHGRVLDFGCGDGWVSMKLARQGYDVYGIDISSELIAKAQKWALELGVSHKTSFREMAGENLQFQENFFDAVIGSAVLHHTDFEMALNSIHRVLKPGGKAIFIEPLNQNVLLKAWRFLTPWRRSPAEKALTVREIEIVRRRFPLARLCYFNLTAILTVGLLVLLPDSRILHAMNKAFERFDNLILKYFPKLSIFCAVIVIELAKEGSVEPTYA